MDSRLRGNDEIEAECDCADVQEQDAQPRSDWKWLRHPREKPALECLNRGRGSSVFGNGAEEISRQVSVVERTSVFRRADSSGRSLSKRISKSMTFSIAVLLAQDGITNGAIYALLALALVLVFTVTRVIFIPSGEFVAYGTLTLAGMQLGKPPGTVGLLVGLALAAGAMELYSSAKQREWRRLPRRLGVYLVLPLAIAAVVYVIAPMSPALPIQILLTLVIVTALGPLLYRVAYQPLAEASVLVLLIVSVAAHFVMLGLGLWFFGAEGSRTPPFTDATFHAGDVTISGQSILVLLSSVFLIGALYLFFERTLYGKALRATALNRVGARLVGISPSLAGSLTFMLAALLGAFSGVLIGPITTIYYDSGFLISLKGFVGAIIGGLSSYPLAAAGSVLVGLLESFSSFWASAFKEVIVFTLIIPVLLWRSLATHHQEEEE
jgi:branched-chain amino acid transport system permease protein